MKKLKPEVSEFYQLITIRPGTYSFPDFGSVDLTAISLEEAHELVRDGFNFLVPKNNFAKTVERNLKNANPLAKNNLGGIAEIMTISTNDITRIPKANPKKQNIPGVDEFESILDQAEQAEEDLRTIYDDAENLSDTLRELIDKAENLGQKDLQVFRGNKKFINKLLTLNYSDLTFKERSVFYHDEKYFNEKRYLLQSISQTYNEMKSVHAALKRSKSDHMRKELNKQLWSLDDHRASMFKEIDTWEHQEPKKESPEEAAARIALEKANEIKTLTNYIGRFEDSYMSLPESSEKERAKKKKKLQQIEQRKARLIELNAPYQRKKRK